MVSFFKIKYLLLASIKTLIDLYLLIGALKYRNNCGNLCDLGTNSYVLNVVAYQWWAQGYCGRSVPTL